MGKVNSSFSYTLGDRHSEQNLAGALRGAYIRLGTYSNLYLNTVCLDSFWQIPCVLCESRRPQDTGENVIVTLKISKEKVIYGVLDGVNNPTNSCGIWSFQNNIEVLQWRRHAEVGAAETDS